MARKSSKVIFPPGSEVRHRREPVQQLHHRPPAGRRAGCAHPHRLPEDIEIVKVPGSWELPVVARELARPERHDAIICLGAVIRGDTPHFDYVAGEAARGIAHAAAETGVPVCFGVLTSNTLEQAIDRAGAKSGNKGFDAAMAAIEMANLMRRLRQRVVMPSRRRSREHALQILFQWDMRKQPVEEAIAAFYDTLYSEESRSEAGARPVPGRAGPGTVDKRRKSTRRISSHAEHWRIERMPAVDRNILRLAVYEMPHSETPARGGDRRSAGTGAAVFQRRVRALRQWRAGRRAPGRGWSVRAQKEKAKGKRQKAKGKDPLSGGAGFGCAPVAIRGARHQAR